MTTAITYPFHITLEVQFRDLDAMGHVNNAVYFSYMETARIKFMQTVGQTQSGSMIVAEATCTYKSAAKLNEVLVVGIGISRFGTKSFDMHYRLETDTGRLVALGKTIQVMYDYQAEQSCPVPEDFKAHVRTYQGDWQPDV